MGATSNGVGLLAWLAGSLLAGAADAGVSGTKVVSSYSHPTLIYTVILSNSGPASQADNPGNEFTDVLPPQLDLVSATASSGVVTMVGNTVEWDGAIAVGGSVTITIDTLIVVAATVSNQGTIAFDADGDGVTESTALTDDAWQRGAADPTVFPPAHIPTLSRGGTLLLLALLAGLGVVALRRTG